MGLFEKGLFDFAQGDRVMLSGVEARDKVMLSGVEACDSTLNSPLYTLFTKVL